MNYQCGVCVVDRCQATATALSEGLKAHNYEVFSASLGSEALDTCSSKKVDVLLLDAELSDMGVEEMLKRIQESPSTRDVAVILVFGSEEQAERQIAASSMQNVDYVLKPYNLPVIIVRIESAMLAKSDSGHVPGIYEALQDPAYTDSLTGLRNRRYLLERLQEEMEKAHRYDYPLSCAVFDLEEIESGSEGAGKLSMDDLVADVGLTIRHFSRTSDIIARYDGTLFACVLPHIPLKRAMEYVDKILKEVDANMESEPSIPSRPKLCAGVSCWQTGSVSVAEGFMGEAMRGLLLAKRNGGDRPVSPQY